MRSLLAALSFFSFIPVPGIRHTPQLDGWSIGMAPLVGLLIGGALAGLDFLLGMILPHPLRDALVVLGWLVVTGGTHIDGLADSLDGLGTWATPERRLEILHDPTSGPFAVAGVAALLIVKVLAASALPGLRWQWLLVTPVIARLGMVMVVRLYPYARREGLGAGLRAQLTFGPLVVAILTTAAVIWLGVGIVGLIVGGIGMVGALLFGAWAWARLRTGITGDVYGAAVELTEVLALVAAVALTG
jgi:adenosylcobinamide-GDP ribazoletransferase